MSYGAGAALQAAVYQRLAGWAPLLPLVAGGIHDSVPPGPVAGTYVSLGPEEVRDASDVTGGGAEHDFSVSVVTDEAGFLGAKVAAVEISAALVDAPLALAQGRLVGLWFLRARARRVETGAMRRIELWFRARVES